MTWEIALPALVGAGVALLTSAGERLIARFFDHSTQREARYDADLAAIERVTFEVRDLATAYWSHDAEMPRDKITEGAIVGRLTFVAELAEALFKPKQKLLWEMDIFINRLDVSCTFDNFGGQSRKADAGRIREIEIAAYRLAHAALVNRRKL
ncbi:hypothetical protein [Shinella sp. DD12]|uniref:hypothetical protein n=1 Tax=Shinella sp. DD12 TaxID=1410620 RepID=UPI00055CFC7C|nr:hypothetical protein [Shinella sp. DD12]